MQFPVVAPAFTYSDMKTLQVAVGVVKNAEGQILISLRDPSLHQGGLWEFPGGKIEPGESAIEALHRELKEELDITALTGTPLITITHQYPDRAVKLHVFLIENFEGFPKHSHKQPIRWVGLTELTHYRFPTANYTIITAIRLPPCYAILDGSDAKQLMDNLAKILANGIKLIQARWKLLPKDIIENLLSAAYPLCRQQGAILLVNSALVLADSSDSHAHDNNGASFGDMVDGIHLTSRHLMSLKQRPKNYRWVAASCHDFQEMLHAQKIGVDFIVLGPVLPTKTHPGATTLGWEQFSGFVEQLNIPVYALGGMSKACLNTARLAGAQGIAGIRTFLD